MKLGNNSFDNSLTKQKINFSNINYSDYYDLEFEILPQNLGEFLNYLK